MRGKPVERHVIRSDRLADGVYFRASEGLSPDQTTSSTCMVCNGSARLGNVVQIALFGREDGVIRMRGFPQFLICRDHQEHNFRVKHIEAAKEALYQAYLDSIGVSHIRPAPPPEPSVAPAPQPVVASALPGPMANLEVDGEPVGAEILVDGIRAGTMPATITVPAGDRVVVVQSNGYKSREMLVHLEEGETFSFKFKLASVRPRYVLWDEKWYATLTEETSGPAQRTLTGQWERLDKGEVKGADPHLCKSCGQATYQELKPLPVVDDRPVRERFPAAEPEVVFVPEPAKPLPLPPELAASKPKDIRLLVGVVGGRGDYFNRMEKALASEGYRAVHVESYGNNQIGVVPKADVYVLVTRISGSHTSTNAVIKRAKGLGARVFKADFETNPNIIAWKLKLSMGSKGGKVGRDGLQVVA